MIVSTVFKLNNSLLSNEDAVIFNCVKCKPMKVCEF